MSARAAATKGSTGESAGWRAVLAEGQLDARPMQVVKLEGHQLVVGRDGEGRPFALDNRCPHEGYPLAQGKLDDCALTCSWHNWKFDVRDGSCTLGGEGVRRYPTRVRAGQLEVDLSEPDPAEELARLSASFEAGLFEHDNGRAIRDGLRLLLAGFAPERLLACLARDDARRAEYGSTHVLALAADCARVLPRLQGAEAMLAIAPVIDLCGEANRRLAPRPLAPPLSGADCDALVAAVEAEEGARAEGLLLGAFAAGVPVARVESWLFELVSRHFTDFGHQLIYLVKARELLERAGEETARELYTGLLHSIVLGTREDTLPYMRSYSRFFEGHEAEYPRLVADAREDAPFDAPSLRAAALDGTQREACQALWDAMQAGVPAPRLARTLVVAAATRFLRFDVAHDGDPDVAENWLWVTHRFTFASAVRNAVERWRAPGSLRLLAQCLAFVHTGRPMDAPEEQRLDPRPESATAAQVLAAIAAREPERAVARVRGYLASKAPLAELRIAIEDLCLADPFVRPIVVAHAIKTAWAAFEEYDALEGDPERELPLLAAVRFFSSPVVERRLAQTVASSIRWVAAGQMPRKLTQ